MFNAVASGKIKAIWIMATNPVVSMPDADKVKAALESCELVIVSDCESHTDTTACADILLPALAWGEKSGTVTNSERRISRQRAFLDTPGEAKQDWWIISQVAQRMGFGKSFDYHHSAAIFCEHAALSGFENQGQRDFDVSALAAITSHEYEQLTPMQWPINVDAPKGTPRLFNDHHFFTPNGRAQLIAITPRLPVHRVSEVYPLTLNTGRVRDQWHTMTRTARCAKLNNHTAEPTVTLHILDAQALSIEQGMLAKVTSASGEVIVRVVINDEQQQGQVFIPIHWNQQFASNGRVDSLVAGAVDPISGQPEFKHTPVKIAPYHAKWHGFILSRSALTPPDDTYWVAIKGSQFWRYELASESTFFDMKSWAQQQFGYPNDWLVFEDEYQGVYRAAKLTNNQLNCVAFMGRNHHLPPRSWLGTLFHEDALNDEVRQGLLSARPGLGTPDIGTIVCACFGVGENSLIEAITVQKANTIDRIGDCLKAGTNCGSCIPEIKKLLSEKQ